MNTATLIEELKIIIDWIKFADAKSAFLWTIYLAITWGLYSIKDQVLEWNFGYVFFYFSVFILLVGYIFLILSVLPRTKNHSTKVSLVYYWTISKMKITEFSTKVQQLQDDEVRLHLIEQIYTNSTIASIKMFNIRCVIYSLAILIIIWLVFLIVK